jgi:hypothetical protein
MTSPRLSADRQLSGRKCPHILSCPYKYLWPRPIDKGRGESAQPVIAFGFSRKNDHTERHTRVLEVQQIALNVLPCPPTRLNLETNNRQKAVNAGNWRRDAPYDVKAPADQRVLRGYLESRRFASVSEKQGEFAIQFTCIVHVPKYVGNHLSGKSLRPGRSTLLDHLILPVTGTCG